MNERPFLCSYITKALPNRLVHSVRPPPPLISIFGAVVTLLTDTYFRIYPPPTLLTFCNCAYALFPHPISSSGVCLTLGGERRLLQPRFVFRSLTPPHTHIPPTSPFVPAWSDKCPLEDSMHFYVTFFELSFEWLPP